MVQWYHTTIIVQNNGYRLVYIILSFTSFYVFGCMLNWKTTNLSSCLMCAQTHSTPIQLYKHTPDYYRAQWYLQHLDLFKYINFIEAFPTRSTNIYISQLHMQNIKMAKFQRNLGLTLPSHNKWVCNCKWDCLAIPELLVYLRTSSLHWNQIRESRKMSS